MANIIKARVKVLKRLNKGERLALKRAFSYACVGGRAKVFQYAKILHFSGLARRDRDFLYFAEVINELERKGKIKYLGYRVISPRLEKEKRKRIWEDLKND